MASHRRFAAARCRATPGNYSRSSQAVALALIATAQAALALGGPARARAQQDQCVAAHAEAQRLRLGGKLLDARTQLLACAQRECPELVANDCTLWLTEVESSLSSVVLAVEGAHGRDLLDVRVFANERLLTERTDGRALPLDPGSYEFRFEAAGHEPLTVAASIRQSEKNRIVRVQLAPLGGSTAAAQAGAAEAPDAGHTDAADDSSSIPLATWVLGGVSLASFGTFAYFAIDGKAKKDELEETCEPMCSKEQVEPGKRAYLIADIALGVGIASAAAAVIVYFAASGDDDGAARAAREPSGLSGGLTADGARLQWTARY